MSDPDASHTLRYLTEAEQVERLARAAELPETRQAYDALAQWWRSMAEPRSWAEASEGRRGFAGAVRLESPIN